MLQLCVKLKCNHLKTWPLWFRHFSFCVIWGRNDTCAKWMQWAQTTPLVNIFMVTIEDVLHNDASCYRHSKTPLNSFSMKPNTINSDKPLTKTTACDNLKWNLVVSYLSPESLTSRNIINHWKTAKCNQWNQNDADTTTWLWLFMSAQERLTHLHSIH